MDDRHPVLCVGYGQCRADRESDPPAPPVPGASPAQIDALHAIVRKLGHLTEYGVLAALWLRAFVMGRGSQRRVAAASAWIIALVWAVVDESYQSTVASRSGSALDVVIDAVGAFAVALPGAFGWRRRPTP